MVLSSVRIQKFKSINDSGDVPIDQTVTALVGQNEAGKTAFLQALNKANSVESGNGYNYNEQYPRGDLIGYEHTHAKQPAVVAQLTYKLNQAEVEVINSTLGCELLNTFSFTVSHDYADQRTVGVNVPESHYVKYLVGEAKLGVDLKKKVEGSATVRSLIGVLNEADLNAEGAAFLEGLKERFAPEEKGKWDNLLEHEIWKKHLGPNIPKFLYFDDYHLLPGRVNLPQLAQSAATPAQLTASDKTVLGLLVMAGVELKKLTDPQGYENIKARLEALSNRVTDRVFSYWRQNEELEVEFDIRPDPTTPAPFNNGANLYIRIKNRRHRVTVPFDQRSRGFIWFFSFIVWFDSVKAREGQDKPLILLLDEPGLSLHALAQADFLRYIDELADKHQILYTTHSPFMVRSDELPRIRVVEDRKNVGTVVSANVSGSDPKTLFPLQAALGYTIAQNLFIAERNLLVEGPTDLLYLKFFSSLLESQGKAGLRDDIVIVPAGGLDKVVTFVALLHANNLQLAVLHDYGNRPDERIQDLVRDKLVRDRQVLNYAMFRPANNSKGGPPAKPKTSAPVGLIPTDVEDLMPAGFYLGFFNAAFAKALNGPGLVEADLPPGSRLVERIGRALQAKSIQLRPSGGFNHYTVANRLVSNPPKKVPQEALAAFERAVTTVNQLFT